MTWLGHAVTAAGQVSDLICPSAERSEWSGQRPDLLPGAPWRKA